MASRAGLGGRCRALMAAVKSTSSSSAKKASVSASPAKEARPKVGLLKVVSVSPQLGKFLGATEASRSDAVKKVWEHIKLHNLQVPLSLLLCFLFLFDIIMKLQSMSFALNYLMEYWFSYWLSAPHHIIIFFPSFVREKCSSYNAFWLEAPYNIYWYNFQLV